MAEIVLQFVLEDAISSRIIAWFSAGHFSHVDCVMPDGRLLGARSDKGGAAASGVQLRQPDYAKFISITRLRVLCSPGQRDRYHAFLQAQLGKPYDHKAIWAFLFNRDWRQEDSWICSELQSAAGEHSTILQPLFLSANKIVPVTCAVAFSAVGGSIQETMQQFIQHPLPA